MKNEIIFNEKYKITRNGRNFSLWEHISNTVIVNKNTKETVTSRKWTEIAFQTNVEKILMSILKRTPIEEATTLQEYLEKYQAVELKLELFIKENIGFFK